MKTCVNTLFIILFLSLVETCKGNILLGASSISAFFWNYGEDVISSVVNTLRTYFVGVDENRRCDAESGVCVVGETRIDPTEFLAKYPHVLDDSLPQNEKVLCPYLRLLERYNFVSNPDPLDPYYSLWQNIEGTIDIGQAALGGFIPSFNSMMGQLSVSATKPGYVNYNKTHLAIGIAHECAFTFEAGGQEISEFAINRTVSMLREYQDENGDVTLQDMNELKYEICEMQGINISLPGRFENSLTFSFLGGDVYGKISVDDFDRFMNGLFPMTMGWICPFWGLYPFNVMCIVPPP